MIFFSTKRPNVRTKTKPFCNFSDCFFYRFRRSSPLQSRFGCPKIGILYLFAAKPPHSTPFPVRVHVAFRRPIAKSSFSCTAAVKETVRRRMISRNGCRRNSRLIPLLFLAQCRVSRCQTCDRHAVRRATYVVQTCEVAELYRRRFAAMLAADTAF